MNLLVFVGHYNIIIELIILLSSAMKRSDAPGERIGVGAKFGCANQFPCYLDLIPLLFGCYSAVNSAVNSAVIPSSIPLNLIVNASKYLNQRTFSRRFSQETAASDFFSPITGESGFPAAPESVHGEPPRASCRERSMLEKYATPAADMRRAWAAADLIQLFSGPALANVL